ncbi:lysylphosphatidylglycerol synthase transmembrane domain-containing protein [Vreelandella gomseomensis]|uniref:Lysylphosphatidylglycerol synthase transmembrane domain-containing protein n=1 Tax=Vreelandella gomseomensis TaxID=370766 RepID=A0ABU1GDX7_9GAMM|nr:lysylphosphatidylglycerol synthase transmembrane domain-containing protein [Halomonas gomseomensis]MDR5875698.1 lysylphosphatidylglycerol synthase transmembrane domain-containing protein [Halomonas gomseomensis]
MRAHTIDSPRRRPRLRPIHGVLLLGAILTPLVLTSLAGGQAALAHLTTFPLGLLALMVALAALCWNINATRLRLMLNGRAGRLSQGGALGIEMATKFALCATPGGSGGPATLLALLAQRGFSPAKGAAMFLIDQGCDLLFFLSMLIIALGSTLFSDSQWPHQGLIEAALLALLAFMATVLLAMRYLSWLMRCRPLRLPGVNALRRRWLIRRLLRCRHALKATLALPRTTLALMLGLTALHWVLRYSLLYIAVLGVGGHADWLWTFLTQMLAMAASQFSFLPGGAGAAEVGVGGLLLPLMNQGQVVAAVLIWRLVSYHLYLLVGAPLFFLYSTRWLNRRQS